MTYEKEWQAEKEKHNRRLLTLMEQPTDVIDLAYFCEAIMWYDIGYLKSLGLKIEFIYGVEFHITPKNGHVYLYFGGKLYKKDTINVKAKTS